MAHMQMRARRAQAMQPGAQQRRRFHVLGEYPSRRTDKCLDAQTLRPLAQGLGAERIEQWRDAVTPCAVARNKLFARLRMREIHPADAREQKLSPERWHCIEKINTQTRVEEYFGSHESGRTAADDGDRG